MFKLTRVAFMPLALAGCLLVSAPISSTAQTEKAKEHKSQDHKTGTAADNTKRNKAGGQTADNQSNAKGDRELTAQIRRAIVGDKSLSTYAHNVKIIVDGGMVTLRGPVRSDEEKTTVEAKASEIAGKDKIHSELKIAPDKK